MLEVLIGMFLPMLVFGAFALLAVWLGAESRPWFDERPVHDDRPNWWPISRRIPSDDEPPAEPPDGTVVPMPEPAAVRQPAPAPGPTDAGGGPGGVPAASWKKRTADALANVSQSAPSAAARAASESGSA